jgi:formamidopyrimidine-DNA glycosylase
LGFDPLLSHPTLPDFLNLLNARPRATIKGVIMDQSFSAGVGNWVADEVLYQAKVHPACPVGKLGEEGKEAVWREMKRVVDIAVEANANHAKFPKGESVVSGLDED